MAHLCYARECCGRPGRRIGRARPRVTAATLGLAAFVVIAFVLEILLPAAQYLDQQRFVELISLQISDGYRVVALLVFCAVIGMFLAVDSDGQRMLPTWHAAVFGTLSILLICRIARRLTRSTLLGCIAGLLMSLDGLEFVMSRTGLLDIFLMFFILAAFGCLVIDRDVSRARLAAAMAGQGTSGLGPGLGIHWWRVAAGFFLGCACASKQFGAWYILGFAALAIAWDVGARRAAGLDRFWRSALLREAKWLPISFGLVPLAVYLASWSGWFASSFGWDRHYAASQGVHTPVLSGLYSLYEYHVQMLQFGVGLHTHHPYESQPWDWLVISRPVAYFYTAPQTGAACRVAPHCSQEVLAIGTPAIWWAAIPALIFCLFWWLLHRDWRAGAVVLAMLTGWVTWFPFVSRTKFYYYALEFEPFLIICIVLCLGLIIGPATARLTRRAIGSALAGVYVLAVLVLFWYFYPILAGQVIPYTDWLSHMWYAGWI